MNLVLQAVRRDPRILFDIVNDPRNHLNTRPISFIEWMAFDNIERQAFGKRRFARASLGRHRTFRRHLTLIEHKALQLETKYMRYSVLQGFHLYDEIARVLSIKLRARVTWREVKDILESASEVIADLELN